MERLNLRKIKNGDRFGRLVVTGSYVIKHSGKWKHDVLCDCGNVKKVISRSLICGGTTSCGCYQKEVSTTHGLCKTPEYISWSAMLSRTRNDKQVGYKNYGGRGIRVCDRWLVFENFLLDMGFKPSAEHSIDRIDNDKSYYPSNCKWSTRVEQNLNQRTRSDNKTGCKGVSFRKSINKYVATIQLDGKRKYLGGFKTLESAILARQQAEKEMHNG